jgi:hypothetical protein
MQNGDSTISTYGTFNLPLLERVKQAAAFANYGIDPFPQWQPMTLLGQDRAQWPSFGLEVIPKSQLAGASDAAGVGESLLALCNSRLEVQRSNNSNSIYNTTWAKKASKQACICNLCSDLLLAFCTFIRASDCHNWPSHMRHCYAVVICVCARHRR